MTYLEKALDKLGDNHGYDADFLVAAVCPGNIFNGASSNDGGRICDQNDCKSCWNQQMPDEKKGE